MAISVNRAVIVGRVGKDPVTAGRDGGIVKFSVATSEGWKDRATGERQERTQWHSVVVYNEHAAKFVRDYARKGDLVYVEGTIETRKYEKDGQDVYVTEIVVRPFGGVVQLQSQERREAPAESGGRGGARTVAPRPASVGDDDIPF